MGNTPNQPQSDRPGDLLEGAAAIAEHLRSEGLDVADADVYYLARARKLAIGKFGKSLIASKARLTRDLQRAAKAHSTA